MSERPCRLCEEALGMTREQIRALVTRTRLDDTQALVPDDDYEQRLAACEHCDALSGFTCMQCGCIVPMRAMQASGACPHPSGGRWPVLNADRRPDKLQS